MNPDSIRISALRILLLFPLAFASSNVADSMGQAVIRDVDFETFRLIPGETQTQFMTVNMSGVREVTVTKVSFEDGELSNWVSVEKDIPFTVHAAGELHDLAITFPITVRVPSSYMGGGGDLSAHIDLSYELDGQGNLHTVVQKFGIVVNNGISQLWLISGMVAAIAAGGALYGLYVYRKRKN